MWEHLSCHILFWNVYLLVHVLGKYFLLGARTLLVTDFVLSVASPGTPLFTEATSHSDGLSDLCLVIDIRGPSGQSFHLHT